MTEVARVSSNEYNARGVKIFPASGRGSDGHPGLKPGIPIQHLLEPDDLVLGPVGDLSPVIQAFDHLVQDGLLAVAAKTSGLLDQEAEWSHFE